MKAPAAEPAPDAAILNKNRRVLKDAVLQSTFLKTYSTIRINRIAAIVPAITVLVQRNVRLAPRDTDVS